MKNDKSVDIGKAALIVFIIIIIFIIVIYEASKVRRNKDNEYVKYAEKYEGLVNQINYKEVKEADMAKKYLSDFVHISIENREKAYELIDEYYKDNAVETYKKFSKKMDILMTPLYMKAKLFKYSVSATNKYKIYFVEDAAGNRFIFKEKSIMNYSVYLDTTTVDL